MLRPRCAWLAIALAAITLLATACVPGGSLSPRVSPRPSATTTPTVAPFGETDAPITQGVLRESVPPTNAPNALEPGPDQAQSSRPGCRDTAAVCADPTTGAPDAAPSVSGNAIASKTALPTTTTWPPRTPTSTPTRLRPTATEPAVEATLPPAPTGTPLPIEPTRQPEPTQPAQAPTDPAGEGYPGPGDGVVPQPGDGYPGPVVDTPAPPTSAPPPTSPPSDGYPGPGGGGGYPGP